MFIRALEIFRDELHVKPTREEFVEKLGVFFEEEADAYRDEHDKSYLNKEDLKEIGRLASDKFVQAVIDRKFR